MGDRSGDCVDARLDDRLDARRALSHALRPFVDGTARGMSSWVMTERRVAATARDAAVAILPLLGTPARSAQRVRQLIIPVLTCGWTTFEALYEETLSALLALPQAVPGVPDPAWDHDLVAPAADTGDDWQVHGARWTPGPLNAETVGPSGTVGWLVLSERRRAVVAADGRPVRTRAQCHCAPVHRHERGAVPFELVTFGRHGAILDVRTGVTCSHCRAPVW